jgi:hypothetical protein
MRGRTALVVSWLLLAATARAQDEDPAGDERLTLRAEAGLEYDSNAHRSELIAGALNPPIVDSLVQRFVLSSSLSDVIADGQGITMGVTAAGKLFDAAAARDEDVAIAQTALAWQKSLRPGATLAVSGAYYEAFQRASANLLDALERRDFRSLTPNAQLVWPVADRLDLTATAGSRWFVFKPDRDFDFQAPTAALDLHWARPSDGGADWEASTGASFEYRTFGGPALIGNCPTAGLACPGPNTRRDSFLVGRLEVTRVARVLAAFGYALQINQSNSYGESVIRNAFSARFATPLPAGLMLAARGELVFAHYPQSPPLRQIMVGTGLSVESIDNENRCSVRVDLSRDLTDRLRLFARYTYYVNELALGSPVSYHRQTALLSLLYDFQR